MSNIRDYSLPHMINGKRLWKPCLTPDLLFVLGLCVISQSRGRTLHEEIVGPEN